MKILAFIVFLLFLPFHPTAEPNNALGLTCNGVTDDRDALNAAVQRAELTNHIVQLPSGTCIIEQTKESVFIGLPSNIVVRGNHTKLVLTCPANGYAELFRAQGVNIHIENVTVAGDGSCSQVLVAVHAVQGLTLNKVTLLGAQNADNPVHGVMLTPVEGPASGINVLHTTMRNLDYGLFQPSTITEPVRTVAVIDSHFSHNRADDLEFNGPNSSFSQVQVRHSVFLHNRARQTGAGFAVGLAHVHGARIVHNVFRGYYFEPVHIEDRSRRVWVSKNWFTRDFTAGLNYASHIFIVSNSTRIRVVRNVFDGGANCREFQAVFVGPGGAQVRAPSRIAIRNNHAHLRPESKFAYLEGTRIELQGNSVDRLPSC